MRGYSCKQRRAAVASSNERQPSSSTADEPHWHAACEMGRIEPRQVGVERESPRRHRASARALVAQRQSLVWPVTASARGRSFLADPGTCRAGPATPMGVQ